MKEVILFLSLCLFPLSLLPAQQLDGVQNETDDPFNFDIEEEYDTEF
jgi:hypothetical protein